MGQGGQKENSFWLQLAIVMDVGVGSQNIPQYGYCFIRTFSLVLKYVAVLFLTILRSFSGSLLAVKGHSNRSLLESQISQCRKSISPAAVANIQVSHLSQYPPVLAKE
jgi:hypothetical protein